MKAVNDTIIVKKEVHDEVSKGGIIVEMGNSGNQNRGEVISVGDGVLLNDGKYKQSRAKKGNKVLFSGGTIINNDGDEYIFLSESNLLAIL